MLPDWTGCHIAVTDAETVLIIMPYPETNPERVIWVGRPVLRQE